jgi:hypothetical protein
MKDLLIFPEPGNGFRDSGEGGQFVMLVVPEPENWSNNCHVDVGIHLNQPDVCHNDPEGFWASYDHDANMTQHDLFQYLSHRQQDKEADVGENPEWAKKFYRGLQYREWGSWVLRANGWDYLSQSCLAAVHMGSSQFSLWDEEQGRYWLADHGHLTQPGKAVHESLQAAFGIEPILLTFLDT